MAQLDWLPTSNNGGKSGACQEGFMAGLGLQDAVWSPVKAPAGQHRRLRTWLISCHFKVQKGHLGQNWWRWGPTFAAPQSLPSKSTDALLVAVWPLSQVRSDWFLILMEKRASGNSKRVVSIRVLENNRGRGVDFRGAGGHNEGSFEGSWRTEQESEAQMSPRAKQVQVLHRTGKMVSTHLSYVISWKLPLYAEPPEMSPAEVSVPFPPGQRLPLSTQLLHILLRISFLEALCVVLFPQAHFIHYTKRNLLHSRQEMCLLPFLLKHIAFLASFIFPRLLETWLQEIFHSYLIPMYIKKKKPIAQIQKLANDTWPWCLGTIRFGKDANEEPAEAGPPGKSPASAPWKCRSDVVRLYNFWRKPKFGTLDLKLPGW